MKKLITILSLLTLITIMTIHFTTFKPSQTYTMPISSIDHGNIDNIYINFNGHTVKAPQNGSEFILIKDKKYGNPKGSFTLTEKVNVFGLIKYEAHSLK